MFPDLRLGLLHGRMALREKQEVMESFQRHELDILVSTPVVEVGIDVANAAVMLIDSADRFGLSQIHQFRGRVGRGPHQSYCLLLADAAGDTPVSLALKTAEFALFSSGPDRALNAEFRYDDPNYPGNTETSFFNKDNIVELGP